MSRPLPEWMESLYEASKRDDTVIVGSDIRRLVQAYRDAVEGPPRLYVTLVKQDGPVREVSAYRVTMQGPFDPAFAEAMLLAQGKLPEGVTIAIAGPDIVNECETVADLCVQVVEAAKR